MAEGGSGLESKVVWPHAESEWPGHSGHLDLTPPLGGTGSGGAAFVTEHGMHASPRSTPRSPINGSPGFSVGFSPGSGERLSAMLLPSGLPTPATCSQTSFIKAFCVPGWLRSGISFEQ